MENKNELERAKEGRTTAESARKFQIEQAGAAESRGLQQKTLEETQRGKKVTESQAEKEFVLSEEKFEEDNRLFGLDYAIKQREVAVKEIEAAAKAGVTQGFTPETGQALQLVNEILPNAKELSGLIRIGKFTGSAEKLKQLVSNLSVNARKLIKGQGQVSDYEAKVLADSTNALGQGYFSGRLSEKNFEYELKRIRGVLNSNAGMAVSVRVTDPSTGEVKQGPLSRDDIFDAASQGYIVEYD